MDGETLALVEIVYIMQRLIKKFRGGGRKVEYGF